MSTSLLRFSSSSGSSDSSNSSGSVVVPGRIDYGPGVVALAGSELHQITLKIMEKCFDGPAGIISRGFKNPHGLIGKHDYILLEYAPGEWIKAEKVAESRPGANDAGIHVSKLAMPKPVVQKGVNVRYEVKIDLGQTVRWTLGQLLDILTSHNPDYHLLAANCWKYAFAGVDSVLKWCIEKAVDDAELWDALKEEQARLKRVERPMPQAVIQMFGEPFHPESAKTRELWRQKLSHTKEHLPKDSRRRKIASFVEKKLGPSHPATEEED